MNLTLLLDLDDTLLSNPLESFMPAYIKGLSQALAHKVDPKLMIHFLLAATDKMIEKTDFAYTLEQEFDHHFYPSLGIQKSELHPFIETYYMNGYQNLKQFTSPRSEAVNLVEAAFADGNSVVVATNPLFPEIAISSRLEWANLSQKIYPFSIVTTYESFHFAKPNPAYYAEILAQLGMPDQPACMIGNSLKDDIVPALEIGMPAFLVLNTDSNVPQLPEGCQAGSLQKAKAWVKRIAVETPQIVANSPQGILPHLRSAPAAIDHFLEHLLFPNEHQPNRNQLTVVQNLLSEHLIVESTVNYPRLMKILKTNGDPPANNIISTGDFIGLNSNLKDEFSMFCSLRSALIKNIEVYLSLGNSRIDLSIEPITEALAEIKNTDQLFLQKLHSAIYPSI